MEDGWLSGWMDGSRRMDGWDVKVAKQHLDEL